MWLQICRKMLNSERVGLIVFFLIPALRQGQKLKPTPFSKNLWDGCVSSPLVRGNASTGAIVASTTNFGGTAVFYRGGQIFDDHGNFYSAANLALLGSYPGVLDQPFHTALAQVDPAFRRVFYLAGYFNYGASSYTLKVYDRELLQPLFQAPVPSTAGSPARFLRCGSNVLDRKS